MIEFGVLVSTSAIDSLVGQLPSLRMSVQGDGDLIGDLPPLTGFIDGNAEVIDGRLPAMQCFAFELDGDSLIGAMPPLTGWLREPSALVPSVNVIFGYLPAMTMTSVVISDDRDDIDGDLPALTGVAFENDEDCFMDATLPVLGAFLNEVAEPAENGFLLLQSDGYVYSYSLAGYIPIDVSEAAAVVALINGQVSPGILERISAIDALTVSASLIAELEDSGIGYDAIGIAWVKLVQESIVASDATTAFRQYAMMIVDSLVATGAASCSMTAIASVIEAASIEAVASGAFLKEGDVESTATMSDQVSALASQFVSIMESILAEDTLTPSLTMVVLASDAAVTDDAVVTQLTMMESLQENGHAFVTIRLGADEYTAWVMNPSNRAIVEYRNFAFNSFADHAGSYYGANDSGLYVLDGDDDDGDPIEAWIKDALRNLGTSSFKRFGKAYLGIKTNGDMVFKIIETSTEGQAMEYWYTLEPRVDSTAMREASMKAGGGISSVYFAWELHNVEGSDFELDAIEFMPIILDKKH